MSNPPLPEHPVVEPYEDDGKIVNKVVWRPTDNKSPLDGVHYNAQEMSLRAKLNLGVEFRRVPNVNIDNDPTVVQRNMLAVEHAIESRLNDLQSDLDTPEHV